jgi:hypothetical protein
LTPTTGLLKIFKEAVRAIHTTINSLVAWQGSASWEALAPALDAAGEVVTQHLKAITAIRESLIKFGDLSRATSLMDDLVQDQKFPTDYASLKGAIEECSKAPKIDLITRDMLVRLLEEITEFQYAAFMINPDNHARESYEKAIAFGNSGKLIALLGKTERSEKDESDIRSHRDFIVMHLVLPDNLRPLGSGSPTLETAAEVQSHVSAWCEDWLKKSRGPVVLGKGLHATINAIKARRPPPDKAKT